LNFLDRFWKNTEISNLVKILPVWAELFHAYGQTDMTKIMVALRIFCDRASKLKKETEVVCETW